MNTRNTFLTCLICLAFLLPADARGAITQMSDLDIRILYDNSGSMYPGYRLQVDGDRIGKSRLGVGFFHEYAAFREWLRGLIAAQGQMNGKNVSITAFTENELEDILPPTPREQITLEAIAGAFEKLKDDSGRFRWGQHTELTENLEKFTEDFEGIVWLITDNIIDTREGSRDNQDILHFFKNLNGKTRFRAVHLYKYPFEDKAEKQLSHLAVYGFLISSGKTDTAALEYFDERFVRLKKHFPEQEHLKLKDLGVNPIDLDAPIRVEVVEREGGMFRERQIVRLHFDGEIRSNLTQHTVAAGTGYRIAVEGPFLPDEVSEKKFGVRGIPSNRFTEITGTLPTPIRPQKTQRLDKVISSKVPVTISVPSGPGSFVRSALGIRVRYEGKVRFSLFNVKVKLERGRLAGIYGVDQASSVFDFQDVREIYVKPRVVAKSFHLETGSTKGVLLLLLLLVILALSGLLAWFLLRTEQCRVKTDQKTSLLSFRRLGSHSVAHKNKLVGTLRRGLGKDYVFVPTRGTAGLEVRPRSEMGKYDIGLRGESFLLVIEPLGGGTVSHEMGEAGKDSRKEREKRPGPRPEPRSRNAKGRKIKKPKV